MEGCHNTNWVGGDPTIHLHTIVEAISMLDSFKVSNINKNKEDVNYIESVKADNYNNYISTWRMNSEYAFYQKQLFNSPQTLEFKLLYEQGDDVCSPFSHGCVAS